MRIKTETFDIADFLKDEETVREYLNLATADPNPEMLRIATDNVLRAGRMPRQREPIQS